MAYRVVWSSKALEDVEAIATYISRDSISFASSVVRRILKSSRRLTDFPLSGRIVPEFEDKNIREVIVYSYRIIYRVRVDVVTIAAVIHGRRILETSVGPEN